MINVALIGYGYWGSKLARNFQNSKNFDLVTIIDSNKKKLQLAKKNFKYIECLQNINVILKNDNIDLVIISTPTSTHYKLALTLLNNSSSTWSRI